jgi:hypothetical protein
MVRPRIMNRSWKEAKMSSSKKIRKISDKDCHTRFKRIVVPILERTFLVRPIIERPYLERPDLDWTEPRTAIPRIDQS